MIEEIKIDGTGNIIEFLKSIQSRLDATEKSTTEFQESVAGTLSKYQKQLNSFSLTNFYQQLGMVSQGLESVSAPGMQFNSNLSELSALTGTTGAELDKLGSQARNSAKEFGGNAAASLNNYKVLLSRLGPDIAKNQTALAGMERNVQILSKTMGGDATGAVDALTTAVLQYNVDLSDPTKAQAEMARMMDIMANSAKEGAAEVPQISAALKVAGVQAAQSKVSFEETNAAIQTLAAGGKEGSEAGVALRNILGKMAGEDVIPKEAAAKLKALGVDMRVVSDTSLPFTTRLRELKKAQSDATIMAQVFGVENAASANILLNSVDAQDQLREKITKTGGAMEQAKIVMESSAEKMARMKARIDDVKIGFFEATGGATAYLGPINEIMMTMTSFAPIYNASKTAVIALATAQGRATLMEKGKLIVDNASAIATKAVTAAQWLWNAALAANPIGIVITAVAALSYAVYGYTKVMDQQTAAQRLNTEVKKRALEKTIEERAEVDKLFTTLKNAKKGTDEYKDAMAQLDQKYPGFLAKYKDHEGNIRNIAVAEKELIKQIMMRGEAEALAEMTKESYKKKLESKTKELSFNDKVIMTSQGWSEKQYRKGLEIQAENEIKQLSKQQLDLQAKMNKSGISKPNNSKTGSNTSAITASEATTSITNPGGYSGGGARTASGGNAEMKNINVRIDQLVGNLTVSTTNLSESTAKIKEIVTEALVGAVRNFETSM